LARGDYLKKLPGIFTFEAIAPILVILFHVNAMAITNPYFTYSSDVVLFITSRAMVFVVPGFFFLSGLKLSRKYSDTELKYTSFLTNRVVKIYLPCVFWAIIYYFYYVWRGFLPFSWSELPVFIATGQFVDHLYFIIAIMQFYILFPLFLHFCKRTTPRLGIVIAIPITIFSRMFFDTSVVFPPHTLFFVAGCYAGLLYEDFITWLKKFKFFIYPAYIIVTFAHLFMLHQDITGNFNYTHRETMTVVFCSLSVLVFYHICLSLNKSQQKKEHGGFITRNMAAASYYVFLSHVIVLFEAHRLLRYYLEVTNPLLHYLIVLSSGLIIPYAVFIPYVKLKELLKKKLSQKK